MSSRLRHGFRLGDRTVYPSRLLVEGEGIRERLEPQMAGVLVLLAECAGQPVARAEFFARVWEGRSVSEDVLHRAVSRLRAVLGDDAAAPRVIETIPRLGYRLLLTPVPLPDAPADEARPAEPPHTARRVSTRAALLLLALAAWALAGHAPRAAHRERWPPAREQPLVALPGNELAPAFSPDGREVVFSWDGEDGHRRLYRMAPDDPAPRRFTDARGKDGASAWAPDGRSIAFVRYEADRCRIVLRGVGDGREVELAACHPSARVRLDFTPDGRSLVWSDVADTTRMRHAIQARDMVDGTVRWLTTPPAGMEDLYPTIAPDGASFAFARGVPGSAAEIYRQPLGRGDAERLTWAGAPVAGLDWTGPETLVVASARGGDDHGLWQLDTRGGVHPLELGGDRRAPVVSPDGRRLVFESWRERSNLVRVALDGRSAAVPLAPSSRRDHSPALAPAGDRLAFVSDRTGSPQIWTVRTDGADPARLTSFADAVPARPSWSPDGSAIAFELRTGARVQACVLRTAGGEPRCFDGRGCARAPIFEPGGRALLFGSDRDGAWRIWRRDLEGGAPLPVTERGDAPRGVVGGAVYYTEMRRDGLRRTAEGGADALVLAEPSALLASSLSVDAAGIRYARPDGTIVRCAVDGSGCAAAGKVEGLHTRSGLALLGTPAVAYFASHRKTETELLTLSDFAGAAARSVASSEEPRAFLRRPPGL
ncbi:MAG: winged helix-turn-helix domain-containing protein [Vicinamibacteria bacterium]